MRLPAPHSICALLLLLPAACVHRAAPQPEPVESTGPVLLDVAAVDAVAELLRMEDSRVFDEPLVRRHLQDSLPEIRGRAALAAGRVRGPGAGVLLTTALADPDASVRGRTAFALGELGDTSAAVLAALRHVALRDRPVPAGEAVAALGRLAAASARPTIDSLLTRSGPPHVLHEALLAAWRLPPEAGTQQRIARWTSDPDPETRWRAAYALARNGGAGVVATLLGLVDDPDPRVRAYGVRGLRAGAADSAGIRDRGQAALLAAVRDTHPHVRINAINLLPAYERPNATTGALIAALDDPDPNVAVAAAQALGLARDPGSSAALAEAARDGSTDALKGAALLALARIDADRTVAIAAEWVDSSRWILRLYAARAVGRVPPARATGLVEGLARDSHHLVATEALGAIRALADSLPDPRPLYIEQLAARHPLVRAAAIRGLAARDGPADLDLLLQAYDRARQDTVRDAALAAVHALARLRRTGTRIERAFFLRFGPAGPPADDVLHRAIRDSIGIPPVTWGEPAGGITVRPLEFYRGIVLTYVAPVLAGTPPPRAVIGTAGGEITLELAAADAPLTVHNFLSLIEKGYYRDTRWHRVVPNFVIQDGDPRGDGSGGPGYAIRDEINPMRYLRGTLGMALSGPDSGGSQYFITHSPQPHLDGGYTVFGRVIEGIDTVDRVTQDEPITSIRAVR